MTVNGIQNYQYLSKKFYSNEIIYKIMEKKMVDSHDLTDFLTNTEIKILTFWPHFFVIGQVASLSPIQERFLSI